MAKKITIEQLAEMTKKQFDLVATKEDINDVKDDIKDVLEAIDNLGAQMTDVKKNTVSVLDYVRLEHRVEALEEEV